MALDDLRGAAHRARLNDIGIERSLHQPLDVAFLLFDAQGFLLEDSYEFRADDFALGFGVGNSGETGEEAPGCVDGYEVQAKFVAQVLLHFLEFVFAQDAVVDKDAGEAGFGAVAHRAVDEHGGDRRVDASREGADRTTVADLFADLFDGGIDEVLSGPGGLGSAKIEREVAQDVFASGRVVDFGMELHGPHAARGVLDGGYGIGRLGGQVEAGGQLLGFVAVRHPDGKILRKALKQARAAGFDGDFGVTVLVLVGRTHFSAEREHHVLQAVADAEHGQAEVEDAGIGDGCVLIVDRRWATGEDDADRGVAADFLERGVAGKDGGEDVQFADAARNELGILGAEVENND